jgi:gamma-glutamyltranspeptidase/glutathione hydrolase
MDFAVDWQNELCVARNGVVVTEFPQASLVGLRVLQEGGNAVDAAVATAAALNVVGLGRCGLGGDAFILVYDGKFKKVTGINGSGRAPYAASVDYYKKQGMTHMAEDGIHSVSVPGAVDAYVEVLERFGTMPLKDLLQPAIEFAEQGLLMKAGDRQSLASDGKLTKFPSTAKIFCGDGTLSERAGVLVNTDLGKSLRLVAEGGREAFYKGEIAQAIVACSEANGGLFTMEDFENHTSDIYEPIQTDYRGYTVYETTLPSQGHIVLEELNILEGYDVAAMEFGSASHLHHMVEAKKLAFADRLAYSGDPDFENVPLGEILSKSFAERRREAIHSNRASSVVTSGDIYRNGDTTSFAVADKDGNAVSFIISLSSHFGSGLVADGTGIVLNDRIGYAQGFAFDDGHPNQLKPGKRTMHTLNTYIVCSGDEVFFIGNTPGGFMQPQLNFQAITNAIDFGMSPAYAVDAPAWISFPGASPSQVGQSYVLRLDERFTDETVQELERWGHVVARGGTGGSRKMIMKDPDSGMLLGASQGSALWY